MSRVRTSLLTLAAFLALTAGAPAADEKGHDHGKGGAGQAATPAVYDVHYHDHATDKHVSKRFDTSKSADAKELADLLAHGSVKEIHNASPPTILEMASLSADLGIWTLVIFGGLLLILN